MLFLSVIAQARPSLYRSSKFLDEDKSLLTVGILTQPSKNSTLHSLGHSQYIFEMGDIWMREAGLNAVYIPFNATDDDLYALLDQVNGVFFTGGSLDLYNYTSGEPHPYTVTAQKILNYAVAHTDAGDYFPLLGVCQGHQLLHLLVANNTRAFGNSYLENVVTPTNFTGDPRRESRMLATFDGDILDAMVSQNILLHLHMHGIPAEDYKAYPSLSRFFKVLSTNVIDGQEIVMTAEGLKHPVYTVQFHPEAVLEPATDINAVRSTLTFRLAQSFVNFFAAECAKNDHEFKDRDFLDRVFVHNQAKGRASFVSDLVNCYGIEYYGF